jgi:drug/metabolite transporter (DMT)-like permease
MNTETLVLERPASRSPVLAQMLLCSFLWANSFLLMKLLGADLAPLPLTALRGLMGGGLLALWVLWRGQPVLPKGREWRDWAMLGLLQGLIPNTLTAYALSQIAAGLTSMLQATTPLIVAVLAHFLFAEERLRFRRILGVLVGFAGMAILLSPSGLSLQSGSFWGALAMIATAFSYALGSLYVRSIPVADPARLALGQQVFSGLPAAFAALALFGPQSFAAMPDHILALAALGFFGTALPIVLFMNILRRAGPTLGSMNGYLTPIWTVLLGFLILGETATPNEIAGGAIVLLGIVLANDRRANR